MLTVRVPPFRHDCCMTTSPAKNERIRETERNKTKRPTPAKFQKIEILAARHDNDFRVHFPHSSSSRPLEKPGKNMAVSVPTRLFEGTLSRLFRLRRVLFLLVLAKSKGNKQNQKVKEG